MKLKTLGEDRVVSLITACFQSKRSVVLGIGDDCAVVNPPPRGEVEHLKTDTIVEGIHFDASVPDEAVGRKAVARVLSDFAAMGARPCYLLVTLGLPESIDVMKIMRFAKGMRAIADRFDAIIVGGETVRTQGPVFITIAGMGRSSRHHVITRHDAQPGDIIYVSGCLGNSIAGHHYRFTPRIKEGQWLAKNICPTAMMDLSDGLGSDLPRLARASAVGYDVDDGRLPLRNGASIQAAWRDGEDYELLFTVAPRLADKLEKSWRKKFPRTRLTRIGVITARGRNVHPGGFDHFSE